MENMKKIIFDLENKLQQPDVRKSTAQLSELISDEFVEIGSSGQIYGKNDVLTNLPASHEIEFKMADFKIKMLTPEIVQSFFKTEKINKETGKTTNSLRSSLWKNENGTWKMMFHQGTPINN